MHKNQATRMGWPGLEINLLQKRMTRLLSIPKLSEPEHFADINDVERRAQRWLRDRGSGGAWHKVA